MISDMSWAVLDFKSSEAVTALFQIRRAASAAIGTFSLGDSSTGTLDMVYDSPSRAEGTRPRSTCRQQIKQIDPCMSDYPGL